MPPPGTDPDPGAPCDASHVCGANIAPYIPIDGALLKDDVAHWLLPVSGYWEIRTSGLRVSQATYDLLRAGEPSGALFVSGGVTYALVESEGWAVAEAR